jgi:hypothetical protein
LDEILGGKAAWYQVHLPLLRSKGFHSMPMMIDPYAILMAAFP